LESRQVNWKFTSTVKNFTLISNGEYRWNTTINRLENISKFTRYADMSKILVVRSSFLEIFSIFSDCIDNCVYSFGPFK